MAIESGIVTQDTWLLIQALPEHLRAEYEDLVADSIIFYPRELAANNGTEYDELIARHRSEQLPWKTTLNMPDLKLARTVILDDEYASLKVPIGEGIAKRVGKQRERAQREFGKGSGEDVAWKFLANTTYGVLASPYHDTNNFVAANLITAKVRAEAFAMMMSLNGIQVITDGCTYRADQVPACTFQECLEIQPDYPVRRAETKIPFLDPKSIPTDAAEFTGWYRNHVKSFFDVSQASYDELFSTHHLEHKTIGDGDCVEFDGLACDGAANYIKYTLTPGGEWEGRDFKARSYGRESKSQLLPWITETYVNDTLIELPPSPRTGSCSLGSRLH